MHSSSIQACLSAPVTVWLNRNLKITSIWATSIRMPGTVFSLTGSAQRFLRLSYVGCPLEMIPEGIHCIVREIDWLLQNGAAHVGDSFWDIALPQQ